MSLGRVRSFVGVVGMNTLVLQPGVAMRETISFVGVGSCIGR